MLRTITDDRRRDLVRRRLLPMNDRAGVELPMALTGCTLDASSLGEQLDRYRRLGQTALNIEQGELAAVITFGRGVDVALLNATVAIEAGCCSFFTLDYEPSERRLSIAIDDPARVGALRAVLSALSDTDARSAAR
jgi:hypothetical protein